VAVLWGDRDERAQSLAEIAQVIDAHRDQLELDCRLPEPLVAALRSAGAFRLPIPAAWGGPELPMVEIAEVLEELAYLEGAVGWCAMIGCDGGFYTAWLDDEVGRAMYADLDAVTAGWVVPAGSAVPVDGGHRLTGRWSFGSGSTHADWFCTGGLTADTMQWRLFFLPAEDVAVVPDSWDTTGLRGTGSNDYAITDAFVPEERSFDFAEPAKRSGTLYGFRGTFALKVGAVPIGLARRALDEVVALAERKIVMPQLTPLRDLLTLQEGVAKAEALIFSSRAYYHEALHRLADAVDAGGVDEHTRRHAWLSAASSVQACRQAVELLAELVGTDSVRRSNRIERIRRDLVTASTHIVGRTWGPAGRHLLGLDPGHPIF
jgi:alkylation response protein AidB-like acyl-CoA dehydrogenase